MKDAKGHGSNARESGGQPMSSNAKAAQSLASALKSTQAPVHDSMLRVEKELGTVHTAAGQRVTNVRAWQKVAGPKRRAVAESIARGARVDNPNNRIRIR